MKTEEELRKNAERQRRYREANREKVREDGRAYREANRDRLREKSRAYHELNRDKRLEQKRSYDAANRDRLREKSRAYLESNREARRIKRRNDIANLHYQYVASRLGMGLKKTPKQLLEAKREQLLTYRCIKQLQSTLKEKETK